MTMLDLATGCTLELLDAGERWLGIGSVHIDGVPMRDPSRPILPEIRTSDGIELVDWQVTGRRDLDGGGLAVDLEPARREGGPMDWMLHRVHNRYRVADWSAPPSRDPCTSLTIELRPVRRQVRGAEGRGFSYRFRYHSLDLPIHRMLDRATWEPGGRAACVELWLRNGTAPSIARFHPDRRFSTEWWLPGCHNPSIFQFMPFQTQFPGFTMTAAADGALVTWVDGIAHVRSLFEKPRGWDAVLHLHEHCDDLANDVVTRPVEVLWFPGHRDRVSDANLWEAVREYVHDRLHAEAGIRPEQAVPYGVIEEWGMPDLDRYVREGVPALLAAGARQIYLANMFANNMNTWGTANFCCTVDWRIAESVGEAAVRRFCAAVHAGGATVQHWGNTALSTYTWLNANANAGAHQGRIRQLPEAGSVAAVVRTASQPFVRNMAGHYEMDHYSPVFCQVNLRDPAMVAHWHACWRDARERIGFDGIFLDSSFNMSSDKFHWIGQVDGHGGATIDQVEHLGHVRPNVEPGRAILSQYRAHLDLVRDMQSYGYTYSGEDIGVFGVHRSGPDVCARLDNLFMWSECLASWDPQALRTAGADPDDVFFRGLAYRCVWSLYWHVDSGELTWRYQGARDDGDRPTPQQLAWIHAFDRAREDLHGLTILDREAGALYGGGRRRILWAFRDLELPLPSTATVIDLIDGTGVPTAGVLHASARHVYAIA